MDTNYFFLDKKIQAYVEDEHEILIVDDIMRAISFNGGIYGTTAVLVDAENIFGKRALNKNKPKIITRARETHKLCWRKVGGGNKVIKCECYKNYSTD